MEYVDILQYLLHFVTTLKLILILNPPIRMLTHLYMLILALSTLLILAHARIMITPTFFLQNRQDSREFSNFLFLLFLVLLMLIAPKGVGGLTYLHSLENIHVLVSRFPL